MGAPETHDWLTEVFHAFGPLDTLVPHAAGRSKLPSAADPLEGGAALHALRPGASLLQLFQGTEVCGQSCGAMCAIELPNGLVNYRMIPDLCCCVDSVGSPNVVCAILCTALSLAG
jgi:hypothetical protein